MANIDVVRPSPSAPVNRMALEVDSVRLGGGETVNPSLLSSLIYGERSKSKCFEGSVE